jgi:hypothetical protein
VRGAVGVELNAASATTTSVASAVKTMIDTRLPRRCRRTGRLRARAAEA